VAGSQDNFPRTREAAAGGLRRLFSAGKIYNEPHGKRSRERFHLAIKP